MKNDALDFNKIRQKIAEILKVKETESNLFNKLNSMLMGTSSKSHQESEDQEPKQ